MKKRFITMSTLAVLAACTATPLAAQAKGMTALAVNCGNSADQNTSTGQWIILDQQETIKDLLQRLAEKCNINLDFQPPVSEDEEVEETVPVESVHPYVLRIVELVNEEREKAGLNPVTLDAAASSAAMVRSQEIVNSFSHTRPNGSSFSTALTEQGISYRRAGENIAWGQSTPEQVMEGWMNSSGHRANILGESFTYIGVGYYQENGINYWTQLFYQ